MNAFQPVFIHCQPVKTRRIRHRKNKQLTNNCCYHSFFLKIKRAAEQSFLTGFFLAISLVFSPAFANTVEITDDYTFDVSELDSVLELVFSKAEINPPHRHKSHLPSPFNKIQQAHKSATKQPGQTLFADSQNFVTNHDTDNDSVLEFAFVSRKVNPLTQFRERFLTVHYGKYEKVEAVYENGAYGIAYVQQW